jgi:hypothetical protein
MGRPDPGIFACLGLLWGLFGDFRIDVRQARIYIDPPVRDVAQSGRVLEWGSRGRGFESRRPDHPSPSLFVPFAASRGHSDL